jgi:dolichyl-phosphate-mannose-protein mannosyltransferase
MTSKASLAHSRSIAATLDTSSSTKAWARWDSITVLLLVLCALALYFWRLDQPPRYSYDEVYHAYTAAELAAGNADAYVWYTRVPEEDREQYRVAYEWSHPAFAKLPMQLGIILFGDNPFGWRFSNAIWGAFGIGILYALGRALFNSTVALFAAVLLLFDGLWFVQSRTAMNDVYLVCFLMLAYLPFFFYLSNTETKRWRYLWLTGAALGFALATKWSAVWSFVLLGLIAFIREVMLWYQSDDQRPIRALLIMAGAFVVVPFAIYLGSYVQFFWMGHTWDEWRELQWQMWRYHSSLTATHAWASRWWTWPLLGRPVWYFSEYGEGTTSFVFALGNPLIWWMFLPAIGYVIFRWYKQQYRSIALGLVLIGFLGQWLPWYLSPRISFLYHMLPSVPFGILAIAYVLKCEIKQRIVWGYLALVVITFIFFYPHYAAWPIPPGYQDLLYWLPTWRPR